MSKGHHVLFSNPPWWAEGPDGTLRQGRRAGSRWPFTIQASFQPDNFRFGSYFPFPFFMGYAASYLREALHGGGADMPQHKVVFRDSVTRGESYQSYKMFLDEFKPDFIVIESATSAWQHDSNLIAHIQDWCPEAKIVLCGPIAEVNAEKLLNSGVVALIKGEYEKGIVRVVKGGERGIIPHDLLTEDEMNAAPIPLVDEEAIRNYCDSNPKGQKWPHLQVWASRGCYHKCCFCVWPAVMTGNDPDGAHKRFVRTYSKAYMLKYLRAMIEPYGFKSIYFDDDTFNLIDRHTLGMCEVMREIGLPWSAMCRADTSTKEVWMTMKESGCFGVKLGFESGSQEVIDKIINKKLDLKKAADTAIWLRSIGMTVHGTFTVGLPGETAEQRGETFAFIKELYETGGLDTHQLSGTAEIEGTPLATMKAGEALKAYPNAVKDANYEKNPDGVMKAEHMHL